MILNFRDIKTKDNLEVEIFLIETNIENEIRNIEETFELYKKLSISLPNPISKLKEQFLRYDKYTYLGLPTNNFPSISLNRLIKYKSIHKSLSNTTLILDIFLNSVNK